MISKKDVIRINREFSNGVVLNGSSLSSAAAAGGRGSSWLKTAAAFTRAILIDHAFEGGNKRTAAAVVMLIMEMNDIQYIPEKIPKAIAKILVGKITSLTRIERCLKDAVR